MICSIGYRSPDRIWWMKVFQLTGTHPRVLLVNHLQSREEHWYRASTVLKVTSIKTEIARSARGPKLQGPHAEVALAEQHLVQKIVCDIMTADHNFLRQGCESRHNHRYAVVVQDLATQWIQLYAFETKTFQETDKSLRKFLEPTRKSKVIYTDIF